MFDALQATGTSGCFDPHGTAIKLANATLSASGAQYEDTSSYAPLPKPNVVFDGAEARAIIDAIARTKIDDCHLARQVLLVCGKLQPAPTCGYQ